MPSHADAGAADPLTQHRPIVVGGPRIFGWECACGKKSSNYWPSSFEAAYAAGVHQRNPDGPS